MQIDFHHTTTWVDARAAGFSVEDANIIAYASQYVDVEYTFSAYFITSNGKYFHDAAKKHRLAIIDDILPRYGICVA